MSETFWEKWRHRIRGAWDVLVGRAWAGYGNPINYDFDGDYPSGGAMEPGPMSKFFAKKAKDPWG